MTGITYQRLNGTPRIGKASAAPFKTRTRAGVPPRFHWGIQPIIPPMRITGAKPPRWERYRGRRAFQKSAPLGQVRGCHCAIACLAASVEGNGWPK